MEMKVIAHRGASYYRPENTMAAFDLAFEQGADGIETDLHLSKDGVPVLIHDATVDRVGNKKGAVNRFTYQELKEIDVGSWFDSKYKNERIISLSDFLEWNKDKRLLLNLELKAGKTAYPSFEQKVYDEVIKHDMLKEVFISSFNLDMLKTVRDINESITVAALSSKYSQDLLKTCQDLHFNGVHLNYKSINKDVVRQFHDKEMYVATYTVNDPHNMEKCMRDNCDMLITDRPDLAIEQRQN